MAAAAATVNHAKPASPFKFSAKIAGSIYVPLPFPAIDPLTRRD
jgi:hypothetical protein